MISIGKLHIWLCYKLETDSFNINKGNTKGVFGRVDFKEDEKKKKKRRENEEGKLFGGCLVERRGGKSDDRVQVFSPWAHQKLISLKWREKKKESENKVHRLFWVKLSFSSVKKVCWLLSFFFIWFVFFSHYILYGFCLFFILFLFLFYYFFHLWAVWYTILNNNFQFLNSITHIFTYFFIHTYFHTCFQTTIFNF